MKNGSISAPYEIMVVLDDEKGEFRMGLCEWCKFEVEEKLFKDTYAAMEKHAPVCPKRGNNR